MMNYAYKYLNITYSKVSSIGPRCIQLQPTERGVAVQMLNVSPVINELFHEKTNKLDTDAFCAACLC